MNLNPLILINCNILAGRISPTAGIVIMDLTFFFLHGLVRVSAKNKVSPVLFPIAERAASHLGREPEPALARSLEEMAESHVSEIYPLNIIINPGGKIGKKGVINEKPVKLVPMNREISLPLIMPDISLVDFGADERAKNSSEADIMIPDHPADFFLPRDLAHIFKEFPAIVIEMAEIQRIKNISQEHELAERITLEHGERFLWLAHR